MSANDSSALPGSESPACTVCGKQATQRDIDGNWWPPCEHAAKLGIKTLQYATPALPVEEEGREAPRREALDLTLILASGAISELHTGNDEDEQAALRWLRDQLPSLLDARERVGQLEREVDARGRILDEIQAASGAGWWTGSKDVILELRAQITAIAKVFGYTLMDEAAVFRPDAASYVKPSELPRLLAARLTTDRENLRQVGLAFTAERERAEKAEQDSRRLDWLEANTHPHRYGGILIAVTQGLWKVGETIDAAFNGWSEGEGATLREAIDAARDPSTSSSSRAPSTEPEIR